MDDGGGPPLCERCGVALKQAYLVGGARSGASRCLRCALTYRHLVVRSLTIAVVVGTLLVAINQGNVILSGDGGPDLAWKVPLTYVVPYCVATTGAMLNARSRWRPNRGASL